MLGVTAMGNHPRRKKIQLSEGLGGHTESRGGDGQLALCHGMLNVHEDVLCKFVASPKIFPPPLGGDPERGVGGRDASEEDEVRGDTTAGGWKTVASPYRFSARTITNSMPEKRNLCHDYFLISLAKKHNLSA